MHHVRTMSARQDPLLALILRLGLIQVIMTASGLFYLELSDVKIGVQCVD